MRSTKRHRFCPILCLVGIVLLVGCGHPPGTLADATVQVDASPDAEVVQNPLRSLGSRGLFAETPVENRFFDPTFAQIDGIAWNPIHPFGYDICPVTRLHQRTPKGQPALTLEPPPSRSSGQVVGMAKGAPGPMVVSVWLGRQVGTDVSGLRASLFGLFLQGASAVELTANPAVEPVVLDGVTWVYHSGYLEDGPLSWAYLRISNDNIAPLYISAPVLMRDGGQTRRVAPQVPAVHRPLLPVEVATWQDWHRRMLDRFGGPPRG